MHGLQNRICLPHSSLTVNRVCSYEPKEFRDKQSDFTISQLLLATVHGADEKQQTMRAIDNCSTDVSSSGRAAESRRTHANIN